VDGILTVAVEFLRFAASRGWAGPAGAEALSTRVELRYLPPRFDPGERRGRPVVTRRRVRRRRVARPPATLTCDQVGALVDACANACHPPLRMSTGQGACVVDGVVLM